MRIEGRVAATVAGWLATLWLAAPPLGAEDFAIRNARVHTVTGPVIERGTVVVRAGKIAAVGAADQTPVPAGMAVVDGEGHVLIPGLVDTHSHLGVYSRPGVDANSDGNELTGPVQSIVRALDAIYPADPGIRMATAGGVTTANIMPGSGNVMGGQTAYVKLRGRTVEEMRIDLGDRTLGGMKMANGENPKRVYGSRKESPSTRMAVAALQREIFVKAENYRKKWRKYEGDVAAGKADSAPPERDLGLEPVLEILDRKRTVHFHTHRADDILSAMRLAEEFDFDLVLQHATEAYLVASQIAARKIPASLIVIDSPGGKHEAIGLTFENPGICERSGIRVALHTDDPITESRYFLRAGALAVQGGMTREGALAALTLAGAEMLHLEDRIGSIEAGKDADLVLLSGDPFSVYTKVEKTWIEGALVFDRSRPEDARYATGGFEKRDRLPSMPFPPTAVPQRAAEISGEVGEALGASRFVVLAGRLHTAAGPPITGGVVLVEDGKIRAVGSPENVEIPKDWPVVVASEATPGFIDAHTTVGLAGPYNVPGDQDHDEVADPNQAALRVLDGFNHRDPLLRYLLEHGVTTVQTMPGPDNPIAGVAGIFRTDGSSAESMALLFPSALVVNLGERPKAVHGDQKRMPSTRMGTSALVRKAFAAAATARAKKEEDRERDLGLEALGLALARTIPVVFVAHREDDLLTAVRLADEFGLDFRLSQATEAYLVADVLAKRKVPVFVHPTLQRLEDLETFHTSLENAALLSAAGVPIAITSGYEGYVPKTRVVLFEAAIAATNGLGVDQAMAAITIDAARILGIDSTHGSLEAGKVADLVLFNGDPFEYTTHVEKVVSGGRVVYARSGG